MADKSEAVEFEDISPTFEEMLPAMLNNYMYLHSIRNKNDGQAEGLQMLLTEFRTMAKFADAWVLFNKQNLDKLSLQSPKNKKQ